MNDAILFAQHCAEFLKKRLFNSGMSEKEVDLRIDVAIALMARLDAKGMGTQGPGSPHEELDRYLQNRHLPAEISAPISRL
jgi:hypothetical protein